MAVLFHYVIASTLNSVPENTNIIWGLLQFSLMASPGSQLNMIFFRLPHRQRPISRCASSSLQLHLKQRFLFFCFTGLGERASSFSTSSCDLHNNKKSCQSVFPFVFDSYLVPKMSHDILNKVTPTGPHGITSPPV